MERKNTMTTSIGQRKVDHAALKINQAFIILFLLLAFVLDSWLLVAFVGAVMLLGTLVPRLSLFKQLYQHVLRPAGLVQPHVLDDNPEPHRFAQGFGSVVLLLATVALWLQVSLLGWLLAGVVILLAALNLLLGFCAGCFLYYQLSRRGVPGFQHSPIR
jgi:hypothetical protein